MANLDRMAIKGTYSRTECCTGRLEVGNSGDPDCGGPLEYRTYVQKSDRPMTDDTFAHFDPSLSFFQFVPDASTGNLSHTFTIVLRVLYLLIGNLA